MQLLRFTVRDQVIHYSPCARVVVAESRGHVFASFDLDDEWAGLGIIATFTNDYAANSISVPLSGDQIAVPPEVLVAGTLRVALEGLGDEGAVRLITENMDKPIAVHRAGQLVGRAPGEVSPELWEQVLALIGNLSNLDTIDKSSLVAAINEATRTGGSSTPGEPGKDGITPHIGENGNWYLGETDTGVKARGEDGDPGAPGKDGDDYTLTEADKREIAELAAELVDVPGGESAEKEYAAELTNTGFIRPNGSTSTSANGRYTNRISTNGVTKIRGIAGFYADCTTVAFYAADGTALTSLNALGPEFITSGYYYGDGTFELDITDEKYADAAYFVVSSYRNSAQSGVYTYALDFSDDYCKYTKVEDEKEEPRYRIGEKTIAFFGDSITGGGYPELVGTITGAAVTNYGIGGATVASGVPDVAHIVEDVAAYTGKHEILCVSGGYNDFCQEVPLGALTTGYNAALDTTTLIGALESIFRKLFTSHSEAQIFYVITHKIDGAENRQNDIGLSLTDYHDAIVSVLEKYSIPFYDAFADSGLITSTASDWGETLRNLYTKNADGTHPNVDGYLKYYVYQVIGLLENGTGSGRNGKDGKDYVLTDADKQEIAEQAAALVEVPEGGGGIDVSGATVGQTVKIAAVDGNGVPTAWEATDFPESSGGGGSSWELVADVTLEEDTKAIEYTDLNAQDLRFSFEGRYNNEADDMANASAEVYFHLSNNAWNVPIGKGMFGYVRPTGNTFIGVGEAKAMAGFGYVRSMVLGGGLNAVGQADSGRQHGLDTIPRFKMETVGDYLFKAGGKFKLYKRI